jgi:glycosyltransferase involved in cell wall biosynthesis
MKVAVVTPTIGSSYLLQCLESVQNQTYDNLTHYVFLDGEEYFKDAFQGLAYASTSKKLKLISMEENVGKGWYGHRVYAACSFLVNADVICYLDEDNWLEPDHVKNIVETLQSGSDWVYSLRKIYDKEGNYVCEDNCESLGKYPVFFDESVRHIDTSCFGVRRDVAIHIGHAWYGQWGADRQFFSNLAKHFPNYACTTKYTLCYRLDGNPNSVNKEFFEQGNKLQNDKYSGNYPWLKKVDSKIIGPNIKIIT